MNRGSFSVVLLGIAVFAVLVAQTPTTQLPNSSLGYAGVDVCQDHTLAKTFVPISQAAAGPTTILAGMAGKRWYICNVMLHNGTNSGPVNINLVEGTGANCSSVSAGLIGGTTAATGPNLNSSDWLNIGNGGYAVLVTATAGDNVCYIASGSTQVSGNIVAVNK